MLFLSRHFSGASYLCDFTVDVDLGILAEVVFVRFLYCQVTLFFSVFHLVLSGRKAAHT